jgi:hypothetical protein
LVSNRPEGWAASPASLLGLFDQILGAAPLAVEPHQQLHRIFHIGDEHTIAVLRSIAYERNGCQFIISARKTSQLVERLKAAEWNLNYARTDYRTRVVLMI